MAAKSDDMPEDVRIYRRALRFLAQLESHQFKHTTDALKRVKKVSNTALRNGQQYAKPQGVQGSLFEESPEEPDVARAPVDRTRDNQIDPAAVERVAVALNDYVARARGVEPPAVTAHARGMAVAAIQAVNGW